MTGIQDKNAFTVNGTTVYVYNFPSDITKLDVEVDAIVNSANSSLKHSGGVFKVIATAAGAKLDSECREIIRRRGSLDITDVVKTTAGNIRSCRDVIHAVGPVWPGSNASEKGQQKCRELLLLTFKNVLDFADTNQYRRIAMPPICSGANGLSSEHVATAMCKAIESFALTKWNNTLREIYVVDIHDGVICQVIAQLKKRGYDKGVAGQAGQYQNKAFVSSPRKRSRDLDRFISPKLAKKSDLMEGQKRTFIVGAAEVHVYMRDITNVKVDAIVNSIYGKVDFSKGLSAAIYRAVGRKMEQELTEFIQLQGRLEVVSSTTGGNLCSTVFHAVIPRMQRTSDRITELKLNKQLKRAFMNVLQLAEKFGIKKLAFPPIGSGFGGFPADNVAEALVMAITNFASKKGFKHLREIHVVDNKSDVLNRVISLMDSYQ